MMATDWPTYADDLPDDLIKAGIPISPLFRTYTFKRDQ